MLQLSKKTRDEIGRNVYGEGVRGAVFYHGGHYYDGEGKYLYSNPDTNPPPGASKVSPALVIVSDPPSHDARQAVLLKLSVTQLQKLQREAGVKEDDVIKGDGARAKLIEWLMANTSA